MDHFTHGPDTLSAADLADIYPPLMEEAKWRGTLYSLPMEATGLALTCNKELFAEAGLDTTHGPRTWEELREYAKKLTVDKNGDGKLSRDELRPVSRHTAADWLKRAFRAANVQKPEGSLWHCLRRKWATERKGSPLPDVLAAGGWNSAETFYRCYAGATLDGMRRVVDLPKGKA